MVAFDTLAFSKRLQEAGVPPVQADAQAQAQADFLTHHLLAEVATKDDLKRLQEEVKQLQADFKHLQRDLKQFATKDDLKQFATKDDLELMGKTLTVRVGAMMVVAIGVLATIVKL